MNNALIPAWIIGVPLLLAIVDLLRTPKATGSRPDLLAPRTAPLPATPPR